MYDFLGTFTVDQMEALFGFVEVHEPDLKHRVVRAKGRIHRLGWIYHEENDDGNRVSYEVQPQNSVLAKRIREFQYLGGDPLELDILDRSEWIYLKKGEATLDGDFTGGTPSRGEYGSAKPYDDKDPAIFVGRLKDPFERTIKRLENVEYRIKRTVDLSDRLVSEAVLAANRISGADSIEDLKTRIRQFASSDDYPSAGRDNV